MIFVFGSNLAGRHGKGSALHAMQKYGAQYGVGVGPTGNAYAIPTKDEWLGVLPLSVIEYHCLRFCDYARDNPQLNFHLVAIGCGLAGYHPEQISPFFRHAPANVCKPVEFCR